MFMDQGLLDASGPDGLSYEVFFSNRKSLEAGASKMNYPHPSVMETSNLDGPDLEPSQLFLVQDDNHGSHADNTWLSSASVSGSSSAENPSSASTSRDGDSSEDNEIFSDIIFGYISRMLMEEDVDEKINLLDLEKTVLQAAEKPFYDILGQQYPSPAPEQPLLRRDHFLDLPVESINSYDDLSAEKSSNRVVELSWSGDPVSSSQYTCSSFSGLGSELGSLVFPDLSSESQPALQFKRGMEEAQKFLPSENQLAVGLDLDTDTKEHKGQKKDSVLNSMSLARKKPQTEENLDLQEGKSLKLSAAYSDEALRSEMFDAVLLCQGVNKENGPHEPNHTGAHKGSHNGSTKSSMHGGKAQRKRQQKKDAVDFSTLLIYCAQAVAADDRQMANELLKQIRQNSSPFGDGNQRLAHCFADGLEARLAGTGSLIYQSLAAKRTTAADILKAYQLYITACPFLRISHFFSNHTILHVAENASRVHIIDFGIYFGFQWPCLIHRMSLRPGGPPKLRITGIDCPQPGFRPAERIEETGRRLADYARSFNVPFEYNGIASKWEAIRVEDLKIDEDEVLIVNCLYRFKNLIDETVVVDSPRNKVLRTIREANPDIFVHGVVNGSYGAPFFVTRFREALFHYSALFDMLDTTVARDDAQRLLIERDLFGCPVLNVLSCEGSERVERPETYKQWQVRNLRAGFKQLQPIPDIMKKAMAKVRRCYHKDFVIDEVAGWLLQGWKGRIIYALSTWKPNK